MKNYRDELRTRKRKQVRMHIMRQIALAVLISAALFVFLFFVHLFDVREVRVDSPPSIPKDEITKIATTYLDARSLGIRHRLNSIVFSPQYLRPELLRTFPRIDSLEIRRVGFHIISITIVERQAVGLWCLPTKQECYPYDINGIGFAMLAPSSGYLFIPINDFRDRTITLGSEVASRAMREDIQAFKKVLQFGGIGISEVDIPYDTYGEYQVVTREGWKILYHHDTDVSRATSNLIAFLKEKITPAQRAKLEYVDLRIEDRIYFK